MARHAKATPAKKTVPGHPAPIRCECGSCEPFRTFARLMFERHHGVADTAMCSCTQLKLMCHEYQLLSQLATQLHTASHPYQGER